MNATMCIIVTVWWTYNKDTIKGRTPTQPRKAIDMKNMKERQLAVKAMKSNLGFAPRLEDIIPLESSENYGVVTYVLFQVKGCKLNLYYRAHQYTDYKDSDNVYGLEIEKDLF